MDRQASESRGKWDKPVEFLLSCIGYSVGLGNVWRFPFLAYKNGGASFLVAYFILQVTIGKPLYFLELSIAQFAGKGPVRVWDIVPAARGVGLTMIIISLSITVYYNVLMAYIIYFFFASFFPTLPWTECDPEWNEPRCVADSDSQPKRCAAFKNGKQPAGIPDNCTCTHDPAVDRLYPGCEEPHPHAADLFFNKMVIQESANLSDYGVPSWKLCGCLALAWIIVLFCMIKGIKSTGKVVYVTATFPYFVLIALLIRGALLDGAKDGVKFFIVPEWGKLKEFQLWIDAAGQMFFSLGLSMGGIIMFGSYNFFHHRVSVDALIISSMDMVTSVLAGFVIFTTFGYMAKKTGNTVAGVAKAGYGLAFVAYPEVLSTLAFPQLWSILFFFMLFTLGLDSQFALLETVTTYLTDDFVWVRRRKTGVRMGLALVLYCIGIALCAPGGQYLIVIIDKYMCAYTLFLVALFECISVNWAYGTTRFLGDLEYMLGSKPKVQPFWYFVWDFWDPIVLISLFFITFAKGETPMYNDGSLYGTGVLVLSWTLYFITILPIPFWFFLHLRATLKRHEYTGFTQFRKKLLEPSVRWGPADGTNHMMYVRNVTVWADVLDWECWKRKDPADWDDDFPGPQFGEGTSAVAPAPASGSRKGSSAVDDPPA